MTDLEKASLIVKFDPTTTVNDLIELGFPRTTAYEAHARVFPKKMKDTKRVLVITDLHCGHTAGLTPPEWWNDSPYFAQLKREQKEQWDFFSGVVQNVGKIDVLFVLGDAIDGKGKRSESTELIVVDEVKQADIAKACINHIPFKKGFFVRGTPYHVGTGNDFEDIVADHFSAPIDNQLWVDVNGITFDLKHKIGGSSIPHGRSTSLAKEKLWNREWVEMEGQPKADIFIRGHVHYFNFCGSENYLAMTAPPLQAPKTKYGSQQCSGTVNFGVLVFDVPENATLDDVQWRKYTKHLKEVAPKKLVA